MMIRKEKGRRLEWQRGGGSGGGERWRRFGNGAAQELLEVLFVGEREIEK